MNIEKVINNNLIRTQDEDGREILVMGCGLGFKKKPGEPVDQTKIEKIYQLQNEKQTEDAERIFRQIPLEVLQAVNEIYDAGKAMLSGHLDDSMIAALADHINFALERQVQGIVVPNALISEIVSFYPDEFQVGKKALDIIRTKTGIQLPIDEAGFIALHFINSASDLDGMDQTREMMDMITRILQIIKYDYKMELDPKDIHFSRFITHLKYFSRRIFLDQISESEDTGFFQMVKSQYRRAYQCAAKVQDFIEKQYHRKVSDDEMVYLTVHINRITQKKNSAADKKQTGETLEKSSGQDAASRK